MRTRDALWVTVFVVCWSSGFVGALLGGDAPVPALLAWRYVLTAVLLGLACLVRGVRMPRSEVVRQAVLGLCSHAVFLGGVFASAPLGVDPGTASLVCALQPMLVIAAGRVWWEDPVGPRRAIGLALGLVAVGLAVGGLGATGGVALLLPVASLLGLTAASLLERRWRPSTALLPALTVQVAVSAVAFVAWAAVDGGLGLAVSGRLVGALVWLIVLSGLGGYLGFWQCLRRLGASATSALLYLTPPVTTLWAWLMLGSTPTVPQLAALALGAVAVALVLVPIRPTAHEEDGAPSPGGDGAPMTRGGVSPAEPHLRR